MRRVVVTWIGAITSVGKNTDEFSLWLKNWISGAVNLDDKRRTEFNLLKSPAWKLMTDKIAPVGPRDDLKRILQEKGVSLWQIRKMSRAQMFVYLSWMEAWGSADLEKWHVHYHPRKIAVILWSWMGGRPETEAEIAEKNRESDLSWLASQNTSRFMTKWLIATQAERLIKELWVIHWAALTHSEACAAAWCAIGEAYEKIATWSMDLVVALWTEATISPSWIGGFNSIKALTTGGNGSIPFQEDRDWFLKSEWWWAIILEEYESAKKRWATILAELKGVGYWVDQFKVTAPDPTGTAWYNSMSSLLSNTKTPLEQISGIQTHGTSTPLGDIAETKWINLVFSNNVPLITAQKSQWGHTEWASAIISSIAAIINIRDQMINPIINTKTIDPEILKFIDEDRFVLWNSSRDAVIENIIVNAFAFWRTGVSLQYGRL